MEWSDDPRDAGLLSERGVPGDVTEQADRRDGEPEDREWITQPESQDRREVRRGSRAAYVEVRVPRHHPEGRRVEAEVKEAVPDRPEAAERAVLKIDVIPAIDEQTSDERRREKAR